MKRIVYIFCFVPLFLFGIDGERVYHEKCAKCHPLYIPADKLMKNFLEMNNSLLHLKAPSVNQLAYRLKQRIGDPKGDKDVQLMEVRAFLQDYLIHPDKQKSVCLPEVLTHFETMPSMKGKIDEEEIDAVAEWIYFFMPPKEEKRLEFVDFDRAKRLAQATGKIVLIEVTSPTCHYCLKMERTTLIDPEIVRFIDRHFVPVRVDVSREKLPAGLKWTMTPTFFFLDAEGRLVKKVPGAWPKEDFLTILKEVLNAKGGER